MLAPRAARLRLTFAAVALAATVACFPTGPQPAASAPRESAAAGVTAPAGPTASLSLAAGDMTDVLRTKPLPPADSFELVRRIKGHDGTPAVAYEPVRTAPPVEALGSVQQFWVYDFAGKKNMRVTATLRVMGEVAKWWVANDVTIDMEKLRTSAEVFETKIYPTNQRIFGKEWSPGIDADPRINVLVARIPGAAAGYFNSSDELPRWVNEFSAEREMIYVNSAAAQLATDPLHAVLAHELCHMQQFNLRKRSVVWFNEGQAQLCERANGYVVGFEHLFLQQPDTQLNAWTDLDERSAPHYGASFLFLEYVRHRTGGGYDLISGFMSGGVDTPEDLDRELRVRGHPGVEQLYADFVAANALIGSSADPRFSYPAELRLRRAARATEQDRATIGGSVRASVHQYAARYVELPRSGPYRVRFEGAPATAVIPTTAHSGRTFWWSDRGDGMDATLTLKADLTRTRSASLSYWTWFAIEKDFDYAYVLASTDGGKRWTALETPSSTTTDVNGLNLGQGITGTSGGGSAPTWVQQRVDLTPYAGKEILLRIEYVTDGALNKEGFAIDDIEIPEIGFRDDAEADHGWTASGFVRSTNVVKQRYVVQLIRFGATPTVEQRVVEDGRFELEVDPSADRLPPLLAVTAFAPRTTESASFEVTVTARR